MTGCTSTGIERSRDKLDAPLTILRAALLALNGAATTSRRRTVCARRSIGRLRVMRRKELADVLTDLENVYQDIVATRH